MRALAFPALALGACSFAATGEDWRAQLEPSGPCYAANLLDGLDTLSTAETHAVFACLNGSGAIEAYAPIDLALDGETREGAAGLVLARWIAALPMADLSLGRLVDDAVDLLADPSGVFDALHVGLELIYGKPWPWLGASVPFNSQSALDAGLLVPAFPVMGAMAGAVLDEDLAPLSPLADAARSDFTARLVWTVAGVGASTDPTLAALATDWAPDVSDALARLADPGNDRWSGASGHSLRDLATLLFTREGDSRIALDHLAEPLAPLLADTRLRDALELVLRDQADAGRLDVLPAQVLYLATVDARAGTLTSGEDSALVSLLRLLHDANTEVDCSVDLVFFDVEISLGNLSVELLQLLARQSPATVDGGVGLLGDLLGVSLTDDLLTAVADSGVCPVIDTQLVSDLHAIDRLADPQTDELLFVLLDALAALDDRGQVPALVETVAEAHELGLVPPVEELLRDTADTALATDLLALLPTLLDPWAYHDPGYFPAGTPPLDFTLAWDTAAFVLTADTTGESPLAALAGPMKAALAQSGTWTTLGALGALLAEPDALSTGALDAVGALCEADPGLAVLDTLADTLEDAALVRPLLVLVEADALRDAATRTELAHEGPIPFTARLVHGGTLQVWLDTLSLLTTLLPEEDE
ncbi:MAG: hypothetical protein Q8P18_25920 [Pseudomonadota bacterium]|nr:hypothetical protein [Pseudomonadota bacterium]